MMWRMSHRADPFAVHIADRHYNRQKPGTPQFVPPGRCVVLVAEAGAAWTSSWPFAEYVKHAWAGAWVNSLFRKECNGLASEFIRAAVAITRGVWPDVPALGMVTFISRQHVAPIKRRGVNVWGYSYLQAGFRPVGETRGGLLAFQLLPADMPAPEKVLSAQMEFVF
jgi:hypothetical protein